MTRADDGSAHKLSLRTQEGEAAMAEKKGCGTQREAAIDVDYICHCCFLWLEIMNKILHA